MAEWSESNINTVYLMLGAKCNFHCRYCLQCDMTAQKQLRPTDEVISWLKHLVKIRPKHQGKLKIMFWGGEPLLYLDAIKYTVRCLKDSVRYALVTNGALLDDEFVDYANASEISVTLSNDGILTSKTRSKNVLAEEAFCKRFLRLNSKSVESVISAYNCNFADLFEYLNSKLPNVPVIVDPLRITWDMPKDIYEIDLNIFCQSLAKIGAKAFNDIVYEDFKTAEARVFVPYIKRYEQFLRDGGKTLLPHCGQFYRAMNIDNEGNVYPCHNCGEKIGHISEMRYVILGRFNEFITKQFAGAECSECEFLPFCGGGCPLESGDRKKKSCANMRAFFTAVRDLMTELDNSFESVDFGGM